MTGDLAEWGMPDEFDQVYEFISDLTKHLKLPRNRIALVPGNHDHYGWVGGGQLKWFAERLAVHKADGWLRIGAVHHNVRRGATSDHENLRDADDLQRYLVDTDRLNLVLHGHTHRGRLHWWTPTVPILATGSAALTTDPRPPEVPNQYQLIRIDPAGLHQWCRAYAPDQKRFIADPRAAKDGNDWHRSERIAWVECPWVTKRDQSGAFNGASGVDAEPHRTQSAKDVREIAVAAVAESLALVPTLCDALAKQPLAGGCTTVAEIAALLCASDGNLLSVMFAFNAALPEAARQLRQRQGDFALLRKQARDILGWMAVSTVMDGYDREDARLANAWFDGTAFHIPLGRSPCVEVLTACWRRGKAEFSTEPDRYDYGKDDLTPKKFGEIGFDDPKRLDLGRAVDYVWRRVYQEVYREPAPGRLPPAKIDDLRAWLDILLKRQKRRLRLVIDRHDLDSAYAFAPTLQAIHKAVPQIHLMVIDSGSTAADGVFVLPASQLAAEIYACLQTIETLQSEALQ